MELRYLLAVCRTPSWAHTHPLPHDAFTTSEARTIYCWLLDRLARGESVTIEVLASELPHVASIVCDIDEDGVWVADAYWEPDVPELWRVLRDRHHRRLLELVGRAACAYAADPDYEPEEGAGRLIGLLLGEVIL